MSTITAPSETGFFEEPVATDRARRRVEELMGAYRTGDWHPTRLEGRVAELLLASTAGDGILTSDRVRAALWEGNTTLTVENGGRFARVLADLLPVLDDPQLIALDVVDAAGELVGAVAATVRVAAAA